MKFVCEKIHLDPAVALTGRAVNPRHPLPVLSHILLQARDGEVTLSASDLELTVRSRIAADVRQAGATTISARVLTEVVGQLPDGPVEIEVKGATAEVKARQTTFKVHTMSAEDFPTLPSVPDETLLHLSQGDLRNALKLVSFACASQEETRAVLQGVQVTFREKVAMFVATDGRRLAKAELPIAVEFKEPVSAIIPSRATTELQKALKDTKEDVRLARVENQMFFQLGQVTLVTRLLDGKFPNYKGLLPSKFNIETQLDRDLFAASIRRTLIMAQEKDTPRLVRLDLVGDEMKVAANTPDVGAAEDVVPIVKQGEDLTIAFNGKYLLDALNNLPSSEILFLLTDPRQVALIRPADVPSYLYLIMPVRLKEQEETAASASAAN